MTLFLKSVLWHGSWTVCHGIWTALTWTLVVSAGSQDSDPPLVLRMPNCPPRDWGAGSSSSGLRGGLPAAGDVHVDGAFGSDADRLDPPQPFGGGDRAGLTDGASVVMESVRQDYQADADAVWALA